MTNIFTGEHGRVARWATGITLAGFLAGGGFAAAAGATGTSASASGATPPASGAVTASTSNSDLNALLTASGTNTASGTSTGSGTRTAGTRLGPLMRLRRLGGMYGSFTYRAKTAGDRTLAYERGTIESVTGSDVVVRASDGTTMTWLLETNTVVRDHGKSSASALADGRLVFVGGPVASGARDARLIVIRTGTSAKAAPSRASGSAVS